MTSVEKTGKTVEEALEFALAELNVSREEIDYEILEVPSKALFGFIGGKLAKVKVTVKPKVEKAEPKIDPVAKAKELLQDIFKTMKLDVSIEKMSSDDGVVLNLFYC
jgi:spoIIIJ-associated protein